jgi:hypothetical protein
MNNEQNIKGDTDPRFHFTSAHEIMADPGISELRSFALKLDVVANMITGIENQKLAYDLIRHDRPYCVEWDDGQWFIKNRGYRKLVETPLTDDEIKAIGFEEWYGTDACKYGTAEWQWPIMEDAFSVRFLPQASALIRRIADVLSAKVAKGESDHG